MKKALIIILITACTGAAAQTNNCKIPGWPGCSERDFYRALEEERQRALLDNLVRQQRRANELLEEQNSLLMQQNILGPIYGVPDYRELQRQRCMTMPLLTPGC